MKKNISNLVVLLLCSGLTLPLSGCIWGTAAVVGVAVVGANVEEYRNSNTPRNATEDLERHLEHKREVDKAIDESATRSPDPINTDEIIDNYGGRILDD